MYICFCTMHTYCMKVVYMNIENKVDEGVDVMAVSVKSTPIFKGEDAKKLIEVINNPTDKSELFKKCSNYAKIFNVKKDK